MVNKLSKADKKIAYDAKLCQLLDEYSQILIAAADNVGSTQLQNIRRGLRGDSVVLMGKNTMMKRSVRIHSEKTGNKTFLNLIPLLQVYSNIDYISFLLFLFLLCLSWSFLF
jgi:large subunit ribosomal protein LP0